MARGQDVVGQLMAGRPTGVTLGARHAPVKPLGCPDQRRANTGMSGLPQDARLQDVRSLNARGAGLLFLPMTVASVLAAAAAGRLLPRLGIR